MAITAVEIIDSWGNSPAKVHRPTGKMYINRDFIGRLSGDQWAFIIGHEAGHAAENTTSEFRADELASIKYFSQGRSPKNSVKALGEVLDFSHPSHRQRLINQFIRAAQHDCEVNKHQKSCSMIHEQNTYNHIPVSPGVSIVNYDGTYFDYDEFVSSVDECRGKKGRDLRQCRRTVRQTNKDDRKDTRNDAKAYARTTLADQGMDVTSMRFSASGDMLKGVGAAAAGVGAGVGMAATGIGAGKGLASGGFGLGGGGGSASVADGGGGNGILAGAQNLLGGGVQGLIGGGGSIANNSVGDLGLPGGIQNLGPLKKNITTPAKEESNNNLLLFGGIALFVVAALFLFRK